jgi:hypothetical protein
MHMVASVFENRTHQETVMVEGGDLTWQKAMMLDQHGCLQLAYDLRHAFKAEIWHPLVAILSKGGHKSSSPRQILDRS